jgi:hypothetical protein
MSTLASGRAAAVLLLCVSVVPPALAEGPACSIPQSPRNIDPNVVPSPYNGKSPVSIVTNVQPGSIVYTPRAGGAPQTLLRCGQHYHFPIENPQGCQGEVPCTAPHEMPAPGQWVEIHTVYAAKVRTDGCDPETLDCCVEAPFLVRAFAARVTAGGVYQPIEPPLGRPLGEWSGSTTGPSQPAECKPAAQWSFRLGCDFTVSEAQLGHFRHADPARRVQSGPRLSQDLTLVQ